MWLETKAERFVLGFLALGLIFGFSLLTKNNASTCDEIYKNDIVIKISDNHGVETQLAKGAEQLNRGLSGKKCIGEHQAMLFKFEQPGHYAFWMKEMKFSIDIIWINAERRIVHIEKNVAPGTYPKNFINPTPAIDVLELRAGKSDSLGLEIGTQLHY